MSDYERYGDYNEIDEAPGKSKSPVAFILKLLIVLLCICVVGVLGFRIILFNYYPDIMRDVYYNDTLTEYSDSKGGDILIETQKIRFPYDDAEEGNFFSENLFVVRDLGQLQITLRYNDALIKKIESEYGITVTDRDNLFTFLLARDPRENPTDNSPDKDNVGGVKSEPVGELTVNESDSLLMYTYHKLVFDGIDFGSQSEPTVEWLRVEVYINGVQMDEPYMLLVYENNSANSIFETVEP